MANTNTPTHADVNRKYLAQMEGQLEELITSYEYQVDYLEREVANIKRLVPNKRQHRHYSTTEAINIQTRAAALAEAAANVDRQMRAIETFKDLLAWLPAEER